MGEIIRCKRDFLSGGEKFVAGIFNRFQNILLLKI
jgi:hypothetical protein